MKEINEGDVKILVPDVEKVEDSRSLGFYNPAMKMNRDISVEIVKGFKEKYGGEKILDAFTATGIRAIRYFKEVGGEVHACDVNERALALARKNAAMNAARVKFHLLDWRALNEGFDVIDIDPYGTPCYHIDRAFQLLRTPGLLMVTATDTATLNGVYPNVSLRRYGVKSIRADFSKELAVRILLGFIIREGAKYDRAFIPLLGYQERHYVRMFGLVMKGSEITDKTLKNFKFLSTCSCGYRYIGIEEKCPVCGKNLKINGPYYFGPLYKKDFLKGIEHEFVRRVLDESDAPLYYDVHKICSIHKCHLKPMDEIISSLSERGFLAKRTVFSPTGVKTDASLLDLIEVLR